MFTLPGHISPREPAGSLVAPAPKHSGARSAAAIILQRRSFRVIALTFAIMLMSFGDLHMTLVHLQGVGMSEGNPIARYVIGFNSPHLLAAWKTCSIALACLIFVIARTRRSAEVACWFCTIVLIALTCKWIYYSTEISGLTSTLSAVSQSDSSGWVTLTDDQSK